MTARRAIAWTVVSIDLVGALAAMVLGLHRNDSSLWGSAVIRFVFVGSFALLAWLLRRRWPWWILAGIFGLTALTGAMLIAMSASGQIGSHHMGYALLLTCWYIAAAVTAARSG